MTGNQPHPGTGMTMMGNQNKKISIEKIISALDVSVLYKVNPLDIKAAKEAVRNVINQKGIRVLLFESPCNVVIKRDARAVIDMTKCKRCGVCVQQFGCPAISKETGKSALHINPALCTGCGVCVSLCGPGAIAMEGKQ